VEELAGDLAAAEQELRAVLRLSEEAGDELGVKTWTFALARLMDLQARHGEAESLAGSSEDESRGMIRTCECFVFAGGVASALAGETRRGRRGLRKRCSRWLLHAMPSCTGALS
jgi:hypothetical protein